MRFRFRMMLFRIRMMSYRIRMSFRIRMMSFRMSFRMSFGLRMMPCRSAGGLASRTQVRLRSPTHFRGVLIGFHFPAAFDIFARRVAHMTAAVLLPALLFLPFPADELRRPFGVHGKVAADEARLLAAEALRGLREGAPVGAQEHAGLCEEEDVRERLLDAHDVAVHARLEGGDASREFGLELLADFLGVGGDVELGVRVDRELGVHFPGEVFEARFLAPVVERPRRVVAVLAQEVDVLDVVLQ
mmetsp:Transcript_23081/g.57366  ORF Transcript_23081/g.57366 Transcript_23081/m.57366 type:complete len:244 (-) Transcript_23081:212-943(-)